MKRISQAGPNSVKVESVHAWVKCDFCGKCHPQGKCPRVSAFDKVFGPRKS